ncbi:uncharacterized protein LOC107195962 isoform X2 [Pteropus alecto]|uniref:uncharacterized protein LOC107195962 isoform X2 n=1 Tax=Pteropus alecto TaxID=9402 RepID=UPI0007685849|nr:uncharacterized protein LOC107195962 isoform X2 [Pteropus alecto]
MCYRCLEKRFLDQHVGRKSPRRATYSELDHTDANMEVQKLVTVSATLHFCSPSSTARLAVAGQGPPGTWTCAVMGTRQSAPSQAKDRNRNRTSDTKIFPGSGNKGTIRPCGQVPEDENTPKSRGLAGWLSRYLPRSFPEFAHLLFQRRSTEAAPRCWFRRQVTEEGTLRGEAAWSSFPEDSNSPLKTLVVDSVSENADSILVPLSCQIDSGQGFTVFPCKKSQKCGLRSVVCLADVQKFS